MEYFILKYTWKILYYYFGLCGIYPCKRIGPATLEQTSACKFWITYCIANLVMNLAYQPVMCYIVFVESSLEEMFNMLNTFIMPTNTTKFSFTTNLVIEIIIHIIGIVNIQKFAKRLVKIQNLVNDFAIFNIGDLKKNVKRSLTICIHHYNDVDIYHLINHRKLLHIQIKVGSISSLNNSTFSDNLHTILAIFCPNLLFCLCLLGSNSSFHTLVQSFMQL